jgi:hypothetical protein
MNEVVIVHESTIFDKRRVRLMNELDTTRSRALKISSTTKKENKRSSCRSLKAKMKDLLRHRARVDYDSNDDLEQKIQNNRQIITSTRFLVAIRVDYRIVLRALILFFR